MMSFYSLYSAPGGRTCFSLLTEQEICSDYTFAIWNFAVKKEQTQLNIKSQLFPLTMAKVYFYRIVPTDNSHHL